MSEYVDLLPLPFRENFSLALKGIAGLKSIRSYINNLNFESASVLTLRFIILSFLFAILQIILFSTYKININLLTTAIQVAILDFILSIILFPTFYIPLKLLHHPFPCKVIFGLGFPLRIFALTPAIIFYSLFIITEDYMFVVPRAIFSLIAIITIIVAVPWLSFNIIKIKSFSLLIALVIYLLSIFILFKASYIIPASSSLLYKTSLFYDPIGDEVDRSLGDFSKKAEAEFEPKSFHYAAELLAHTKVSEDRRSVILDRNSMINLINLWKSERDHFSLIFNATDENNKKIIKEAEFRTTKDIASKHAEAIAQAKIIQSMLNSYVENPTANKVAQMTHEYTKYLSASTKRYELIEEHFKARKILSKLWLL